MMSHAITPVQIDRQLLAAGFETPAILIGGDGAELHPGRSTAGEAYFQVIARKPLKTTCAMRSVKRKKHSLCGFICL